MPFYPEGYTGSLLGGDIDYGFDQVINKENDVDYDDEPAMEKTTDKNCKPPDPVTACFENCNEGAKDLRKRCIEENKIHVEKLKAMGCKGTRCSTKKLTKTCKKSKPKKKKSCAKKAKKAKAKK